MAGDLQGTVAGPVALEGRPNPVRFEAVELDHDRRPWPEAIDLERAASGRDPGVELRARQAMTVEKREEAFLEPAAGTSNRKLGPARETRLQLCCSPAPGIALEQVGEREAIVEPQEFRLAQGALDEVERADGGEVEESARDSGDRDPALGRPLVRRQSSRVTVNAIP